MVVSFLTISLSDGEASIRRDNLEDGTVIWKLSLFPHTVSFCLLLLSAAGYLLGLEQPHTPASPTSGPAGPPTHLVASV